MCGKRALGLLANQSGAAGSRTRADAVRFEQDDRHAGGSQAPRGSRPGESTADDDNPGVEMSAKTGKRRTAAGRETIEPERLMPQLHAADPGGRATGAVPSLAAPILPIRFRVNRGDSHCGTCLAVDTAIGRIQWRSKHSSTGLPRSNRLPYPVVSLYLNTQPGQTGRDQFHTFVRKEFDARGRTYPAGSPERESLDKDLERIPASSTTRSSRRPTGCRCSRARPASCSKLCR